MSNQRKDVVLYNVLFPLWMVFLFPEVWLIVLPGNFLIDSLVLVAAMAVLKIADRKQYYKKHILKIFGFGLLADLIGSLFMFLLMFRFEVGSTGDDLYLTIPGLLLSAVMIFLLNYAVTFRKEERSLRLKLSLTYAIVTAPYTFLVPTSWLYR